MLSTALILSSSGTSGSFVVCAVVGVVAVVFAAGVFSVVFSVVLPLASVAPKGKNELTSEEMSREHEVKMHVAIVSAKTSANSFFIVFFLS